VNEPMPTCTKLRAIIAFTYLVPFLPLLLLLMIEPSRPASAQVGMTMTDIVQSDLLKKPTFEQSTILAEAVRRAWKGRSCTLPKVSLEKTYSDQGGGWLVLCDEGQDYWALVRDRPKSATVVLPCILARQSGTDCYANLQTILPEDIKQCAPPSGSLDRVIRSCTAIIQSHQFDNRPDVVHLGYAFRAIAFGGYQQLDLAIADFDKAVALQPANIDTRFNRAVTLEQKGEYDQALNDLAKVIEARPNDLNGFYERGYVYLKKGEYGRAIDDFDQVLRINPQFEKAIRARTEAMNAKGNPSSPKDSAPETTSFPRTSDEQAAYCLEASFGYTQQLTKLVAILRDNLEKGQTLLGGTSLSPPDRTQLVKQMTALNESIASNDAKRTDWDAKLRVFTTYAQEHGLFTKDPNLIKSMSGHVRNDQEAVRSTYSACLRGCAPNDPACRGTCNEKADNSDASKRMLRCAEIVTRFK
jgi:tetratricopeptide (TPR) repeat protein